MHQRYIGSSPVSPCSTAVVSPTNTTTYTINATNKFGSASDSAVLTLGNFFVKIISPSEEASVNMPFAAIRGEVINPGGSEIGIEVNGVLAQVANNEFIANQVPLEEGLNVITAKVTDTEGNEAQASIQVYGVPVSEYVTLIPSTESGLGPLEVIFTTKTFLSNPVSSATLTCIGPTSIDITQLSFTEYRTTLAESGLYECTISLVDSQSNTFTGTSFVNVVNKTEMETFLKGKWDGMRGALINGSIEEALSYFVEGQLSRYRQAFEPLISQFSSIFSAEEELNLVSLFGNRIQCENLVVEDTTAYSYPVTFVRDENGLWKILQF